MKENLYSLAEEYLMMYAFQRFRMMEEQGMDFVHYSSDQTVYKILEKGKIWLRNISFMNDYAEMHFGRMMLLQILHREDFSEKMNLALQRMGIASFSAENVFQEFEDVAEGIPRNVYIASLSEHRYTADESEMGRLSMWRAYSHGMGAALVISRDFGYAMMHEKEFLYLCPVIYVNPDQPDNLVEVMDSTMEGLQKFPCVGEEHASEVKELLIRFLCMCAVAIKHIGFYEEREWRIVLIADFETSRRIVENGALEKEVLFVNNVLQKVYKVMLYYFIHNTFGKHENLQRLIKGIIIGPTQNAMMSYEVFVELLEEIGFVGDLEDYVQISNIPLRM